MQSFAEILDSLLVQIVDGKRLSSSLFALLIGGRFICHQEVMGCLYVMIGDVANLIVDWKDDIVGCDQDSQYQTNTNQKKYPVPPGRLTLVNCCGSITAIHGGNRPS